MATNDEKGFAWVNDSAEKEYKALPIEIQYQFGVSLNRVQESRKPLVDITALSSIGNGVIELKINGSPAYRCVYIAKYNNVVYVLHSFEKTTNGVDRKAMKTATARYKELMSNLRSK